MAPHIPKNTEILRDGCWYSLIIRHPRSHLVAQWNEADQAFEWEGNSERKYLELAMVDEVLHDTAAPEFG